MVTVYTLTPKGYFGSNCFIINCAGEFAVIDPSVDYKTALERVPELAGSLRYIILTHCHFDHILKIDSWVNASPEAEILVGKDDARGLSDPTINCYLGFLGVYDGYFGKYSILIDGDRLPLGSNKIRVISAPGHTPGGMCYRIDDHLFVGDTLFAGGGYGRCDLPGGNFNALEQSIIKIITREPDAKVYCGHGENTTLMDIVNYLS